MANIPVLSIEIQLSNNDDGSTLSSKSISNKSVIKPGKN